MLSKRRMRPGVELMDPKVLLSAAAGPARPKFVDITGEVMRMNLTTPPRTVGRSTRVYNFSGTGGVAEMGSVQVQGSATDTGRNGGHAYKGNLTLTNSQGSVTIKITGTAYRITRGTGFYRGAKGLGVVSYGTVGAGELVGLAFSGDH